MYAVGIVLLFLSCSGYKVQNQNNPLADYGINSLAVPQFVNYSNIPEVAETLTKDFIFLFAGRKSLKLYSGENAKADATLVGIVDGPKKRMDTIHINGTRFINDNVLGERRGFEIPYSASYDLIIRIMIIKDAKVIVERSFPFRGSYTIATSADVRGNVNFTKNQAVIRQSVAEKSRDLAESFENLVLNAF